MATKAKYHDAKTISDDEISLKILIAKRNSIYSRMQSIYDLSISSFDAETQSSFLSTAADLEYLRNEFKDTLEEYNIKNLKLNPDAEVDFQPMNSFHDLYSRVKSKVLQFTAPHSSSKLEYNLPNKFKPSLPPMELLSFNGDIRHWSMFYQQFKTLVHDNPQLTDAERVYYLLSKLSDKALSVCAGLMPTAENYSVIWNALIHRYNDERALAATYINQLLDLKNVNANTAAGFQTFMDKFDASINALKQLNIEDISDFLFLNIALRKLDTETVKTFEMSCRKVDIPKYPALVQFLFE